MHYITSVITLCCVAGIYCKCGNFHMWVIFLYFALLSSSQNYHVKIKPICFYEGNSSIVKITPTWNVLPTFSRNFPPVKITMFTVYSYSMVTRGKVKLLSRGSGEDLGNCCQRPKAESNSFPDLLPQEALKQLFYYPIVLHHWNMVYWTPMLVVDIQLFDVLWRQLSRDQSTVLCWPVNSFFCCLLT